jgi:hypothetical protein
MDLDYYFLKDVKAFKNDVQLVTGLYFSKGSYNKMWKCYKAKVIASIIRTILFSYVFKVYPQQSVAQIIYGTPITFSKQVIIRRDHTALEFAKVLDFLFGKGFTRIANRAFHRVLIEYMTTWRYWKFGSRVYAPTADEYESLFRFVNTQTVKNGKFMRSLIL